MFNLNHDQKSVFESCKAEPVVVAVSGGSDSLALLFGLIDAGFSNLIAITIDHGLREEAAVEALFVGDICKSFGISHHIIKVKIGAIGNIQANARKARFDALIQYCQDFSARVLMLGHTADDQVETFLMRAFRGSGVEGLAAMEFIREQAGIKIMRPMLNSTRADMRTFLNKKNVRWIDDPSNQNLDYDRVKIRSLLAKAEDMGFEKRGIIRSIENMAQARDAINAQADDFIHHHVKFLSFSIEAKVDRVKFCELKVSVAGRVLIQLGKFFGGRYYAPRKSAVAELIENIKLAENGGEVFGHSDFHWSARTIRVCAEHADIARCGVTDIWQHEENLPLLPLGKHAAQWQERRGLDISYRAAMNLPAVYDGENLINFLGKDPLRDVKYKRIQGNCEIIVK